MEEQSGSPGWHQAEDGAATLLPTWISLSPPAHLLLVCGQPGCWPWVLRPGCVLPFQAQRWRSENFERPVDLEGSGDDDSFPEDELDDLYSGSGSGCKYLPVSLSAVTSV